MKVPIVIRHSGFVICLFLAACANEGQTYANKHPELTPVQRKIMATGKIPDGTAVAGLTREQVRMALGSDPSTFDRQGDEDALVFSHKKAVAKDPTFANAPSDSVLDKSHGYTESDPNESVPRIDEDVKTTVYFNGNIATHARTVEERPQ